MPMTILKGGTAGRAGAIRLRALSPRSRAAPSLKRPFSADFGFNPGYNNSAPGSSMRIFSLPADSYLQMNSFPCCEPAAPPHPHSWLIPHSHSLFWSPSRPPSPTAPEVAPKEGRADNFCILCYFYLLCLHRSRSGVTPINCVSTNLILKSLFYNLIWEGEISMYDFFPPACWTRSLFLHFLMKCKITN